MTFPMPSGCIRAYQNPLLFGSGAGSQRLGNPAVRMLGRRSATAGERLGSRLPPANRTRTLSLSAGGSSPSQRLAQPGRRLGGRDGGFPARADSDGQARGATTHTTAKTPERDIRGEL
jgi:hypothetical protein